MADPTTPYLGLIDPTIADPNGSGTWGDKLNSNFGLIDAAAARDAVDGCCRFIFGGPTICQLIPRNGSRLWVGGQPRSVPTSNPIQVTNQGLAPRTLYYAYAYMGNESTPLMHIEFSQVVYVDDGMGHACKYGDPSRRCVGMVFTDALGNFREDNDFQATWVHSYFHRRPRWQYRDFDVVASSPVLTNLITETVFLLWADEVAVLEITGGVKNDTVGSIMQTQITYDGNPVGRYQVNNYGTVSIGRGSCQTKIPVRGIAGAHSSNFQGSVTAGTAEWKMQQIIMTMG